MAWIFMGIGGFLLSLVYFAGKRQMKKASVQIETEEKLLSYFFPAGYLLYLWDAAFRERQGKKPDAGVKQKLSRTLVKGQVDEEYRLFQIKRFTLLWLFTLLGMAAGCAAGIREYQEGGQSLTAIQRPGAGESSAEYSLEVEGDWEGRRSAQLTVYPREYSVQQLDTLFAEAYQQALSALPGENPSLEEVRLPLFFSEASGGLEVSWKPADRTLIDRKGNIIAEDVPEEGLVTMVALTLSYGEKEESYQIPVKLAHPNYTEQELWERELAAALEDRENVGQEELFALPQQVQGSPVAFYQKASQNKGLLLALMGLLAAVFSFSAANQKLDEQQKERELQMQADYPDIVSKLTVYIGAGMTVRGAWEKLTDGYQHMMKTSGKERCYAYEEMLYTYREMQGGQSEIQAYKNFGKRCGLASYRKLSVLLEQNLRRGGKDLKNRLKMEMDEAFSERIHQAKRDGERTSAKLMIPMFLMFILILFLIMAPALMSFSMF